MPLAEACWHALVLGIVQGLTEFLPISSTAHLKVVPVLLGWGDPGVAFTAVIQLGSIAAVLAYFRRDLAEVGTGWPGPSAMASGGDPSAQLGLSIALGTVPILLAGLAIKVLLPGYENSPLRSLEAIAIVSIVMALLLAAAEIAGSRRRRLEEVSAPRRAAGGSGPDPRPDPRSLPLRQHPDGLSLRWLEPLDAARFSFLLGIPAITLAGLVELKAAFGSVQNGGVIPMLVGIAGAAVVSWLAIAWLLRYLQQNSTWIFVAYRLLFGLVILLGFRGLEAITP